MWQHLVLDVYIPETMLAMLSMPLQATEEPWESHRNRNHLFFDEKEMIFVPKLKTSPLQ